MDFASSRCIQGGSVLVAPEAPEELERRRDRSAGCRRRPGGPETCQGMLLVMPRQVSGILGTSSSIFQKTSKTVVFLNVLSTWELVIWEIH